MKRLVVFVVLVLAPSVVFAGVDGKVAGTVTDVETNNPLAGTNVIIVGTEMGASTDAEGKYIILNVPIGTYEIRATFIGYATVTVENVKVNSDLTTNLDFEMPTTDVAGEAVVIVAQEPLVNLTATSVVRSVPAELLTNLATRSGLTFMGLQAGVVIHNNRVFIRGGRSDETGFQIEGVTSGAAVGSEAGVGVTTIPQALAEVKILVGGFSADVGGGAAGIVQQTFKTGTSSMHGSIAYETDGPADSFGDTFSYGYNDLTATLSGPLGGLKYFVAYRKRHDDDINPQFFKGFEFVKLFDTGDDGGNEGDSALVKWDDGKVLGRNHDETILNGNLQLDLNPLVLRFSGAYSTHTRRLNPLPIRNMFNMDRLPTRDDKNSLYNLKASYFLSDNTVINANVAVSTIDFYEYDPNFITDGEFDMLSQLNSGDGDEVAKINPDWAYKSRYVNPRPYNFDGFRFDRPGGLQTGYFKREQSYTDISGGIVTQQGSHEIRLGASLRSGVIRQYTFGSGLTASLNSQIGVDETLRQELIDGTDRARLVIRRGSGGGYGYDEFGNEVNTGPDDAKRPKFTSAYINDKIEFNDIIVNFGVRVDNFDLDTWHLADSANPGYNKSEATIAVTEKAES
ncbi:MAG: carboxypeptidase-like regulatory domain-containing protein, partial [Candidatus Marinimicrobia bacterium]|nr:carboxypeptidase-like regulatory domain-containing protein [Candidatus Neomarinimicrobiota bacterium]